MDETNLKFSQTFKVEKADADNRVVFGWLFVSKDDKGKGYVDLDKSHIPDSVMMGSVIDFMLHSRKADTIHNEIQSGTVVALWPFLDMLDGFPLPDKRRGVAVGIQFDKEVFDKFVSGEYTGFSGGGEAMAVFVGDGNCPACMKPEAECEHGRSAA